MTRAPVIAIERTSDEPQRPPNVVPSWLVSLGLHGLLGLFCLFGLDHVAGGGRFRAGAGGKSLQLIATFGQSNDLGPAGSGLEDDPLGSGVTTGGETSVEVVPPAPVQPTEATPEDAPQDAPEPVPSAATTAETAADATAPEGLAVPETVASVSQTRAIKRKYGQLLQGDPDGTGTGGGSKGIAGSPSGKRGAGAGDGTGTGIGGGGDGNGTSFFEVSGHGSLFCYVVDSSSSMEEENAIGVARAELMASLEQLDTKQQFQILFYDSELHPMVNGRQDTFFATDSHRRFARQFITSQQPNSGTIHKPAILAALKLNPDVIFFLTDGDTPELSFRDLWEIKQANRRRTQIHVIEFGKGAKLGSLVWLEKLASDHRGSYRYQDVTAWQAP